MIPLTLEGMALLYCLTHGAVSRRSHPCPSPGSQHGRGMRRWCVQHIVTLLDLYDQTGLTSLEAWNIAGSLLHAQHTTGFSTQPCGGVDSWCYRPQERVLGSWLVHAHLNTVAARNALHGSEAWRVKFVHGKHPVLAHAPRPCMDENRPFNPSHSSRTYSLPNIVTLPTVHYNWCR
ncbi:uncharacterized protein C8Q71DRAFT_244500 [Rhodofomes roseus]|uniref:Secreted protein n=1 Tax=Rhodofomes roseus TaxID=34475 RepID=A0ABQ8K6X5_9APHY|nr:uncharacterized protein C8Q71DRAFT_244500 [Rhodofomes roseus]KAH9832923.1 hypothetical protein C8Q71DRAFT_244500 [Rhodofomes roseus]